MTEGGARTGEGARTRPCATEPESSTWASSLRQRRLELNISQLELGRRAGLTQQAVSYIERGVGIPRVTTMLRVARALGTTIEELFPMEAAPRDGGTLPGTQAGGGPSVGPRLDEGGPSMPSGRSTR